MNKEDVKKKVKKIWDEHKFIVGYAVGVGVAFIGFEIGWKLQDRSFAKQDMKVIAVNNRVADLILDAHKPGVGVFGGHINPGIAQTNMGELTEFMNRCEVPSNMDFTHFIAFGKKK